MPQNILDLVSDVDLTVFSRQVPEPVENSLINILPNVDVDGITTQQAHHVRKTFTAEYRAFNAEAPIGRRGQSMTVSEIQLPPISEKLVLDEKLIHQLRQSPSKSLTDKVIKKAYDDAENLTISIRHRAEKARGEFLATGKVSINENGFVDEANFLLAADHKVAPAVLWSDPTATPIQDEIAWVRKVRKDAKVKPTKAPISERLLYTLLKNEEYRSLYWQRDAAFAGTLTPDQLNQVRAQYGLPPFNVYEGEVPDGNGDPVRVIADDLYILTTDTVGESQWGTTAESLELVGSNAVDLSMEDAPGLTIVQYREPDPVGIWTKGAAVFLPVAADINGLLVADIL